MIFASNYSKCQRRSKTRGAGCGVSERRRAERRPGEYETASLMAAVPRLAAIRLRCVRSQMTMLLSKLLQLLGDLIVVTCDLFASSGHRSRSVALIVLIVLSEPSVKFCLMINFVLTLLVPLDQLLAVGGTLRMRDEFDDTALRFGGPPPDSTNRAASERWQVSQTHTRQAARNSCCCPTSTS